MWTCKSVCRCETSATEQPVHQNTATYLCAEAGPRTGTQDKHPRDAIQYEAAACHAVLALCETFHAAIMHCILPDIPSTGIEVPPGLHTQKAAATAPSTLVSPGPQSWQGARLPPGEKEPGWQRLHSPALKPTVPKPGRQAAAAAANTPQMHV
jgi:hypothetical protein